MPDTSMLAIYLNDHLAGATGGVELIRRAARAAKDSGAEETLERLAQEIADDRQALLGIMSDLDVRVDRVRAGLGWLAEKAARLKPNGRILTRSPLSTLIEVEAMRLGVEGKIGLWKALHEVADQHPALNKDELARLTQRGQRQSAELEELRLTIARQRLIRR